MGNKKDKIDYVRKYAIYILVDVVISIILCFFDYLIAIGFLAGSIFSFINTKLTSLKFPSLKNSKASTIGIMMIVSFIQMILMIGFGLGTYYLGGLKCFLGGFAGIILSFIIFFINSTYINLLNKLINNKFI